MSWFRRSSASDTGAASTAPQNPHLQALKRQARNRLIGMAVLILAGIALFAWVLDTEPRQTDREIVYDIPARGEKLSVQIPAAAQKKPALAQAESQANGAHTNLSVSASDTDTPAQIRARRRAALAENEEILDDAPLAAGSDEPAPSAAQNAAARALADKAAREKALKAQQAQRMQDAAEQVKADKLAQADKDKVDKAKAEKAQKAKADEAARARALLEGKPEAKAEVKAESKPDTKAGYERAVVQFGSFADAAKAAEVRRKVEGAGLKTYTQEIDTPRGKLIRLRVGPFNKAEDADAAAKKIKALGLPAAILTL
jgi:DedD protein